MATIGDMTSTAARGMHLRDHLQPVTKVRNRRGLPTRARAVSEYMVGLEKTKARAGDVSQSAKALTVDDMHRLYDWCMRPNQTAAECRWGIIRWVRRAYVARKHSAHN